MSHEQGTAGKNTAQASQAVLAHHSMLPAEQTLPSFSHSHSSFL